VSPWNRGAGTVTAVARRDPATPHGAVFMPFAFVEAAANLLTNSALDPFGKIPEFKYCAVRVRKGDNEVGTAAYGVASETTT
jgi:formate dehydrogenase major subunit